MAALSAGSITYTVKNQRRLGNSKVMNRVQLTFAAAQTYPTGGVTVTNGNCGCPNTIESLIVSDEGTSGYNFNYNTSTGKIQMFNVLVAATAAAVPLTEVANTVTPGAMTIFADIIGW
jgi:hypothetical protein